MDTKSGDTVLQIQLLKKQTLLHSIQLLKMVAMAVVLLTIFIAYFRPASSYVFISLLAFFTVQLYATKEYAALATVARRIRLMQGGHYFPCNDVRLPWTVAAGVAVRDGYFLLLLVFDLSWLAHAYLYPSPAGSFHRYLEQLRMGPISGTVFIWFTLFLWLFYAWLFISGILYSREINRPEEMGARNTGNNRHQIEPAEVWMKVNTYNGEELYLQGHRFRNAGKQPLILFPGFFQNGYVYHLSGEISLARFLWENGFDIWIVHPRGTARSEGSGKSASLDDFAGDDIPAVISHVLSKTKIKPVFVGHSQGGISAIISMMGAVKLADGTVALSDNEKDERQNSLKALVTIGSFLNFSFSRQSWLKKFVAEGLCFKTGKGRITLLRSQSLLTILGRLSFVGTPVSFSLRSALLQSRWLSLFLFPVTLIFNFLSRLQLWEFLYHIPNLDGSVRRTLFYKTMDGTFSPILRQFYFAVADEGMKSVNGRVNYSMNYGRVTLPVSIVAMEFDSLADPAMMKQKMFDLIGSHRKFFTVWNGLGHEDHFTNTRYFAQVLTAIRNVSE